MQEMWQHLVKHLAAFNVMFPAARHGRKEKREDSPQPEKKKGRRIARARIKPV
jgi:hypothetical protein